MKCECRLNSVSRDYLSCFYDILDEMMKGMTSAELTDSISYNFIVQMIPHHRAAIQMSENILKYMELQPLCQRVCSNSNFCMVSLQDIAEGIIDEQTRSIKNMQEIESDCRKCRNTDCDVCLYQRRVDWIMRKMFGSMGNACADNNVRADFIREMIPHHRGAIEMSKNTLKYNICSGLIPILEAIIASQQKGIDQMQQLLQAIC